MHASFERKSVSGTAVCSKRSGIVCHHIVHLQQTEFRIDGLMLICYLFWNIFKKNSVVFSDISWIAQIFSSLLIFHFYVAWMSLSRQFRSVLATTKENICRNICLYSDVASNNTLPSNRAVQVHSKYFSI